MTKTIAASVVAATLAACAAPAERVESCTNQSPSANAAPTDKAEPAPASPVPEADAGPTKTEKPESEKTTFEYCAGYWNCFDFGENWLRPNGDACLVGQTLKIYADGTAMSETLGAGTWKGDAYDLDFTFPKLQAQGRDIVACNRVPTNGN